MAVEKDKEFVENIVKAIVDSPDKVEVKRSIDEMGVLLELSVEADDMGKIIGKDGKTAKSIRTLLRVLGARHDSRVNLKIIEPEGSQKERPRKEEPKKENKEETKTEKKDSSVEELADLEI